MKLLTEWGWEVYQEVEGRGGRCDMVGKRENITWAIECKMSFSIAVIEQAYNWRYHANYVSIAVPKWYSRFGYKICRDYGIGILSLRQGELMEVEKASLHRKIIDHFELHEEQKTFCKAGSSSGGHWTNFKRTTRALVAEVKSNPGIEFKEAVRHIDYHYGSFSSAKACLKGFIGTVIPDLRLETVNGRLCVFPKNKENI